MAAKAKPDSSKLSRQKPNVYCDAYATNALHLFATLNVTLVDNTNDADLVWLRRRVPEIFDHLRPQQIINHLPNEREIVQKGLLAGNLSRYQQTKPTPSLNSFYPETYRLYDPKERKAFLKQLPDKDDPKNLWIMKPCDLSSGTGVKVLWQFDDFKQHFANHFNVHVEGYGEQEYIIQRYIQNPLLLEGKKSEIRVYFIIASLSPLIILYYPEGQVRLCSETFKLGDYDNPLRHITNTHQQKLASEQPLDTKALKWTFAKLQDYLMQQRMTDDPDYLKSTLTPKLEAILRHSIEASYDKLKIAPKGSLCFGYFGADFILDNKLNPWLTEIQLNPGLSMSDPVKHRIIEGFFTDSITAMLELQHKVRNNQPLQPLQHCTHLYPI